MYIDSLKCYHDEKCCSRSLSILILYLAKMHHANYCGSISLMVLTMTSMYPSWALEFVKNPTKLASIIFSGKIFTILYLKSQKRASTMTVKVK